MMNHRHVRTSLAGLLAAVSLACGSADPSPSSSKAAPAATSSSPPGAGDPAAVDGDAGPGPTATAASRCTVTPESVTCSSHERSLAAGLLTRKVFYEVPAGPAPAKGWPVVVFFQGSFVPADAAFHSAKTDPFGQYNLSLTVKELLDHGYAVVAPDASLDGKTAWETNVPPWSQAWTSSSDNAFMNSIFASLLGTDLVTADVSQLFAMGISSGGFMSSRMAVSYGGKFRALVVHSGGYATCGKTCTLPATLPTDHAPTMFLHGGKDTVVPLDGMTAYRDQLTAEGHEVGTTIDPNAGHEWLASGPTVVRAWFDAHR